jgi:hypothetical protein
MNRKMVFFSKLVRLFGITTLLAISLIQPLAGAATSQRIVAVGDIHGDFESFVSILYETGIINQQNQWIGGRTILVQTGDLLDRGSKVPPTVRRTVRRVKGTLQAWVSNTKTLKDRNQGNALVDPNWKKSLPVFYGARWVGRHP